MKVLVTGAAGRVGGNVVKRLVASGIEVKAMVMPGDPQAAKLTAFPTVQIVEADLRDQDSINVACQGVTHVVHLAAYMVPDDRPEKYYEINAFGTLRLLEGALQAGGHLERFVLASSDGTYRPGDPPAVPLTEEVKQEPAEYYGTSKLLGEIILRNHAAQFDIPFAIVRFATVVSPEEAHNLFRLRFWRALLQLQARGRKSHIWQLFRGQPNLSEIFAAAVGDAAEDTAVGFLGPDGAPWTLSMVDVRDAAQGVYRALTETGALGRAFNIAAAKATSHEEGATAVSEMFGVPRRLVQMPMTHQLELSIDAARQLIGFRPKYDYRSMLGAAKVSSLPSEAEFVPAHSNTGAVSFL